MKILTSVLTGGLLIGASLGFAEIDKGTVEHEPLVITGAPTMLTSTTDGAYTVPADYNKDNDLDYHYFTLDGKKLVCFNSKQDDLTGETKAITVKVDDEKQDLTCYLADSPQFKIIEKQ